MAFKLLVLMVAVSALEGVFGLPDKQRVNGTQSKAIVGHGKTQRGRRLDKLACIIFHGACQRLDEPCHHGVLEEGPEWCLHSRHFGCCIPQSDTLGCSLNGRVYRDGSITEDGCIRLICLNGEWEYFDLNQNCNVTCMYNGTTIMPFVPHPPLGNVYSISGATGVYVLTQCGLSPIPPCGVDVYIVNGVIECIVIYCSGLLVEICCGLDYYPLVWVNGVRYPPLLVTLPATMFFGANVIVFDTSSIYIICPDELSVCVNWIPGADPWDFSVYVCASKSMYGELYGLSGVWVPTPPDYAIMSNGEETDDLDAFITSWRHPIKRSRFSHIRKNPSGDQTGQVNVRPKIERSMTDIAKICEEMNKDLCTILPSENCEKIMDYCMSSMSGLSDSSE